MTRKNKYRILIGGGGTGGHIFPAISIANALGNVLDDAGFLFVGARGKIEMEKVPEAGYRIIGLPVAGFHRKQLWRNASFFFRLLKSMWLSGKIIREFRPHVVVGVGGYASGPIVRAAARRKIPVIIQEQNSCAGVTNRLLARSAEKICVAYSGMDKYFPAEKIILTGNPIRQDLMLPGSERKKSLASFGIQDGSRVVLMIGGSLGARTLNDAVMQNLDKISGTGITWLWQTGKYYYEEVVRTLEENRVEGIIALPFIEEMNRAFQVADVIISRAGAGTISELCLVGKPAILVPSPNVAEDHQTRNASALSYQQAAILIPDDEAVEQLVDTALSLVNDDLRKKPA